MKKGPSKPKRREMIWVMCLTVILILVGKRSKINVHFRHKPNPNTRGNYHVHTSEAACLSRIFRS